MAMNIESSASPTKYIVWQIPNFVDLPTEQGYILNSSSFSLFDAEDKWYLQILPNDRVDAKILYVLLLLVKESSSVAHRVAFKKGITYVGGKDVVSSERNENFTMERFWYGIVLKKRSTLWSNIDAVAPDGTLTVFCIATSGGEPVRFSTTETATWITVATTPPSVATTETASQTTMLKGVTTLVEDLKDLYFSKRCTDVKIIVKDKEFLAHSHILISRSKVFSSMFNNDMLEKNSGVVEITDCDPASFEDFLIFIYTGNLKIVSPTNATSLYETAEKYDLKDLKEECVRCMVSKLTVDSFCDILHLAAMYNETGVLTSVTNFFIENARDILLTTKWTNFMAENTSLGNELVLKFVDKHTKKIGLKVSN